MKPGNQIPLNSQTQPSGSPVSGEPAFLVIGKLRRTHGLEGELLMEVITDFPERIRPAKKVYVGKNYDVVEITGVRWQNNDLLVTIAGYHNPEEAAALRNQFVYVRTDSLPPLPEGEYYQYQLIGLTVVDESETVLGVLAEVMETGANDVYLVRTPDEKEILLPAIASVILAVDLSQRLMRVRPPEWT